MRVPDRLAGVVVAAFGLLMLAAAVMLRMAPVTLRGQELSFDRIVFIVSNTASLTGFQGNYTDPADLQPLGQACIGVLMLGGTLMSFVVGGWALVRILGMPFSDEQVLRASLWTCAVAILGGATALMQPGLGLWPAVFQSASALGNNGSILGTPPALMDWRTHVILLPLGFLGGLGIPVLLDLASGITEQRRLHRHTVAVLISSALIYLIGLGSIALFEWLLSGDPLRIAFINGSVDALNTRSIGLPLGNLSSLSRAAQWMVMLLMAVGAAPAGSGGGLKTTTLLVFTRDAHRLMFGKPVGRIFGVACVWIAIFILLAFAMTIALLITEPQLAADRGLFIAISALSNCGLSHEPLNMTGASLFVLSGTMLLGRFVPLTILWWCARNVEDTEIAVA
jgi:Trk-type K+ transport system membrane component